MILLAVALFVMVNSGCKKSTEPPKVPEPTAEIMEIKTDEGNMLMWLYQQTPLHRENFMKLTKEGYYDSLTFHRIVPDFVIQGGCPNTRDNDSMNDGQGGPGYMIQAEFVDSIKHQFGAVGAARNNNPQKSSNGSQFYIAVNEKGTSQLDNNYTVFGYIFSGMDVAVKISKKPRNLNVPRDRPFSDIRMDVNVKSMTLKELKELHNFEPL